jgi:hypothetical protein
MKHKIYSYYESIQTLPQSEQFSCANWWKTSWEKNGWDCVMLNKSHVGASNLHTKLVSKLGKVLHVLPDNLRGYYPQLVARYLRWCGLHAAGGGWMSDYDVVNLGFTPSDAIQYQGELNMITDRPCYLFYASQENCAAAIHKFISEEFILDGLLKKESDILNIKDRLSAIGDKVRHIDKSDIPKSEIMASLLSLK